MNKEAIDKIRDLCGVDTFPERPCPFCANGKLRLTRRDIRFRELRKQFSESDLKDFNSESHVLLKVLSFVATAMRPLVEVQAKFSTFLKCRSCGETVIMVGKALIPSELARRQGTPVRTRVIPEYFTPALPIFPLHTNIPQNLRKEITRSFSVFFSDPASCGNAIRHSIETLLDDRRIDRVTTSKSGNSVSLRLVDRIRLFEERFPDAALLHGIRFLGNEASHNCAVKQDDLLEAYGVLEHVLTELYVRPEDCARIVGMSRRLADKYGREK